MRVRAGLLAASVALALSACANLEPPPRLEPAEAEYTALYPYYVEACAVSQIKKKPGFGADIRGGPGGHAVVYLNGVCREADSATTIGLCDGDPKPGRGVGLSVNAHYKNANWVATEGRDFFFRGGLGVRERLTRLAYRRAQEAARAQGIFTGVEFHQEVFDDKPADMSREDWKYEVSIGTDYAIEFARHRYCARVPLDRERMSKVVDYLNALNEPYRSGRKIFEWNVLQDNCSHMIHNALSAVGVWDEWEANRPVIVAAFDFPVPRNEFVNLVRRTNDLPLDDLASLYDDSALRRAVLEQGVIPTSPGALAESTSVIRENDVYDTDLALIFYDEPLLARYENWSNEIFKNPRYFDLRANLFHFSDVYARMYSERRPIAAYLTAHPDWSAADRERFAEFYGRFYAAVDRDRLATSRALERLGSR
jgi:hypothetical protein